MEATLTASPVFFLLYTRTGYSTPVRMRVKQREGFGVLPKATLIWSLSGATVRTRVRIMEGGDRFPDMGYKGRIMGKMSIQDCKILLPESWFLEQREFPGARKNY